MSYYDSPMVKELPELEKQLNPFDIVSLEVFYEKLLAKKTKGTELEYKHGKPFKIFLQRKNFHKIFKSKVGRGLYDYILKFHNQS